MRAAGLPPLERYLSFSSYYTDRGARRRCSRQTSVAARLRPARRAPRDFLAHGSGGDDLSRLLYLDAKTFLPCLNLTYTDKMAMAASVEVRVPLLDDELVALARRIPSDLS